MSDLLNKASLVMIPSGYKEDVVYSAVPTDGSGDLSFTRASNGTRINSAGLVEVCPWNLYEDSENFSVNALAAATIASNTTTAPNGTTTADSLVEDGTNNLHAVYDFGAITYAAGIYTLSCYVKKGLRDWIRIQLYDGTNTPSAYANVNTGVLGVVSSGATASIENVGNGWYRVILSATMVSAVGGWAIYGATSDGGTTYQGVNGSTALYLWGIQCNIGSTAKPYFPTTDRLNVPRLTYQNGGGGCPSLLLEKQSTNLLTYSEQFDNGAYSTGVGSGGSITRTANYGTSPDGTSNADRLQITRGTVYAELYQRVTTTIGTTYTLSFWAKSLSGTPTLYTAWNDAYRNEVTFTTDWVRYTYTFVASSGASGINLVTWTGLPSTSETADILIWGAQLEASSYPTSYIPTTSSSATRVKDLDSNDVFGSNYTLDADFCLFQDFECFDFTNLPVFWSGGNYGTSGDYRSYMITYSASDILLFGVNEVLTARLNTFTFAPNTRYKLAVRRVGSTISWFINGVKYSNGSGTTTTTVKIRSISGSSLGGQNVMKLSEAVIFEDATLTDADCISLTTI